MILSDGVPRDPHNQVNKGLRKDADDTLQMALRCCIALAKVQPQDLIRSCLTCDNFDEAKAFCNKYQQQPPPRIIAFACDAYETLNDLIPF